MLVQRTHRVGRHDDRSSQSGWSSRALGRSSRSTGGRCSRLRRGHGILPPIWPARLAFSWRRHGWLTATTAGAAGGVGTSRTMGEGNARAGASGAARPHSVVARSRPNQRGVNCCETLLKPAKNNTAEAKANAAEAAASNGNLLPPPIQATVTCSHPMHGKIRYLPRQLSPTYMCVNPQSNITAPLHCLSPITLRRFHFLHWQSGGRGGQEGALTGDTGKSHVNAICQLLTGQRWPGDTDGRRHHSKWGRALTSDMVVSRINAQRTVTWRGRDGKRLEKMGGRALAPDGEVMTRDGPKGGH